MKCKWPVRDKKTLELRRCGNHAVKDGLCSKHHPDGLQRIARAIWRRESPRSTIRKLMTNERKPK